MKRYYRSANDPKRFKPLVTQYPSKLVTPYWVVSARTFDDTPKVKFMNTFAEAIAQANAWADEYRAAWVAANMRSAA